MSNKGVRVVCKICEKVQYMSSACTDCRIMLVLGNTAVQIDDPTVAHGNGPRDTRRRTDY